MFLKRNFFYFGIVSLILKKPDENALAKLSPSLYDTIGSGVNACSMRLTPLPPPPFVNFY